MISKRARIYGGFVVLWIVCFVVIDIHATMAGYVQPPDRPVWIDSCLFPETISLSPYTNHGIRRDAIGVMIFREPKGKRKLEPMAGCSEWQVIYQGALMAC